MAAALYFWTMIGQMHGRLYKLDCILEGDVRRKYFGMKMFWNAASALPSVGLICLVILVGFGADFDQKTQLEILNIDNIEAVTRSAKCDLSSLECARLTLIKAAALDQAVRNTLTPEGCFESGEKSKNCMLVLIPKMEKIDSENIDLLKDIIGKFGWPRRSQFGDEAEFDAWLLAQHADKFPEFQISSAEQLNRRVADGEAPPSQAAYLSDRIAVHQSRAQLYGTQGHCLGGEWKPDPIEDIPLLESRRSKVGLGSYKEYTDQTNKMCGYQK